MVFKPVFPVPVRICGVDLFSIQGLFIKRQNDVCAVYAKMLVDNFADFDNVMDFIKSRPELSSRLKAAYLEHNKRVMKEAMGVVATWVAPIAIGHQSFQQLEESMKDALVTGL